jgi:P pilus assembly chaperone PapD
MRPIQSWILTIALLCGLGGILQAQAPAKAGGAGDLMIAPTRVVFEGRKRTAEVSLSNTGTARATFRVSLIRMVMDENGGFSEKPLDPGAENLQSLFRFSPREVTLEPQETQLIRIQVRKPADLPEGEYRLHMVFRGVPPAEEPAPLKAEAPKELSINLRPIYGIAIPLIVRHGETSAKATITDLAFDAKAKTLQFKLNRSGNQSIYGDLQATRLEANGKPTVLSQANGLAVYTPNASRRVILPVNQALATGDRVRVTYFLPDGGALQAEAILTLP